MTNDYAAKSFSRSPSPSSSTATYSPYSSFSSEKVGSDCALSPKNSITSFVRKGCLLLACFCVLEAFLLKSQSKVIMALLKGTEVIDCKLVHHDHSLDLHKQRVEQRLQEQYGWEMDDDTQPLQSEEPEEVAVFYNIFIAPEHENPESKDNTIRIVTEQMEQLGNTTRRYNKHRFKVYYNTLGRDNAITQSFMNQLCEEKGLVACEHMQHFDSGFEEVTLQKVYDYCQDSAHPARANERVVYMHSKGSYHETPKNENWRWHMTDGTVHPLCLSPPDDTCDACGILWQPVWMTMFVGNFFAARCDYINKLIPPMEFEGVHDTQVLKGLRSSDHNFATNLFKVKPSTIGTGRMAQEAWIGSHPSINPCDLSTSENVMTWYHPYNAADHTYEFHVGPRFPLESNWHMMRQEPQFLNDKSMRMREYFLLAGKLQKWMGLYNAVPPPDSWVWKWFPDAQEWQEALEKYGNAAVPTMLEKYFQPSAMA